MRIAAGIAFFPTPDFHFLLKQISSPVDSLQWTADVSWLMPLSKEDHGVIEKYAERKMLSGHGVHYSILSAGTNKYQQQWLRKFQTCPWRSHYTHFSAHFGFSTGWKIAEGAPLPCPFTPEALRIGLRNLELLAQFVNCPIGLENLALALSMRDVEEQGNFIEALLNPFDGFLLLDLHNIYCQSVNFNVDFMTLVKSYPLHRVREIHLSGGRVENFIRRDTHDNAVPSELFNYLPHIIALCPNLRFVFLEQLPQALRENYQQQQMIADYESLCKSIAHVPF